MAVYKKKKLILERVKRNEISPQEGLRLIRELKAGEDEALGEKNAPLLNATASHQAMDIAVIGMAGRFPGARNLDEFWDKLAHGVDCVTEIPPQRWLVDQFYSPDAKASNKTYCRWSGMVPDADCFDPLFFNISPKEAQLMDPQQRLFLEESWRAIEDAGYAPPSLSGQRCGVFAGVMQGDYAQALRSETESLDIQFIAGSCDCFLPARVAYFLNFTGPCMAVNTACSSSLVAINQACQAIVTGEIEIALAGGVSVIATPYHHITSAKSELLARDGRCKSFDETADGFVPSEGVGVVMLKSLRRALADGDHIHGVIKGGRVNQDGRTNGISAPSANSQTQLLTEVYDAYGINPEEISYVEAHGTGTKLGDPIEIKALTQAFRQFTKKSGYCAVGSVKSNIGHALAAAGVGGLIKVLLCMKYDQLPPSLHFRHANKHIDFEKSPFFVNTKLHDWPRSERPRLAVVSSFGLSGTNCHFVVADAPEPLNAKREISPAKHLVVISARTETALARCLEDFRDWLAREGDRHPLADVAYTLATGRSHFKSRVAFTVRNKTELQDKLLALIAGEMPDDTWRSKVPADDQKPDPVAQGSGTQSNLSDRIATDCDEEKADADLDQLGQLYVKGADIDWHMLYSASDAQRISLPTYSFERERFWLARRPAFPPITASTPLQLHPLLHENVSTLHEQRFATRLHGGEFFLANHVVNGVKVLPGVACLVMARVAGELAGECAVSGLQDVRWVKPLMADEEPIEVITSLFSDKQRIGFQVARLSDGERLVIARGWIAQPSAGQPSSEKLDLAAISARCREIYDHATLYRQFDTAGIAYGSPFKLIEQLSCGEGEALAQLGLSDREATDQAPLLFELPLLDATLQTIAGIIRPLNGHSGQHYLPFSLGEVMWLDDLPDRGYAHARLTSRNGDTWFFDVSLADEEGRIALTCRDFAVIYTAKKIKEESTKGNVLGLLQELYDGNIEVDEVKNRIVSNTDNDQATTKLVSEV